MGWWSFARHTASFKAEHPTIHTILPTWQRFTSEFQNMDGFRGNFCKSIESGTEHTPILITRNGIGPLVVPPANPFVPDTASLSHYSLDGAIGKATCFLLVWTR
jgi:hypothetical protein